MIKHGLNHAHAVVRAGSTKVSSSGSVRAVVRDLFIWVPLEEREQLLEELTDIHRRGAGLFAQRVSE